MPRWADDRYANRRAGPSGGTTTSSSSTSSTTTSSSSSSPSSTADPTSSLASVSSESLASINSISAQSVLSQNSVLSTRSVESTASLASVSGTTTTTVSVPASTVFITNGFTVTTTISVPTTSSGPVGAHSGGGSSHTGAIVGGVVGGLGGLAILALLGFCFWRRKKQSEFDGNWDPDRNIQRPGALTGNLDLAAGGGTLPRIPLDDEEDVGDTSPRPFSMGNDPSPDGSYAPTMATSAYSGNPLLASAAGAGAAGVGAAYYHNQHQQPQMTQYHGTAPSVLSSGSAYPPTSGPGSDGYGGGGSASGGLPVGAEGRAVRMNKQQEAARAYAEAHPHAYAHNNAPSNRMSMSDYYDGASVGPTSALSGGTGAGPLSVVNPDVNDDASSAVVQHRDGGRYVPPVPAENQAEIPPSYDSIPAEER
ncbi:hypothetical protein DL93DRAFT_386675 [Clavulina sp. PMI_390]|nr:hypothetical protein DL93DRAFT_386675 [Clavulina sp. PMI_390]